MIPLGSHVLSYFLSALHKFSSALNALVWEGLERKCNTFTRTHDTRRVSPESPETGHVTP